MGLSQGLHLIAEELAKDLQWALGPLQTVQAAAAKHVVNPASQLIQKQYNGTAVQGAVDGFVARIGAAAGALEPYANAAWRAAEPAWRPAQSYAWRWQGVLDSALADVPPHAVVLVGAAAGVMLAAAASWTWSVLSRRRERTALQTFFDTVKAVPGVSHLVARERGRLVNKIRAGVARGDANVIEALPAEGMDKESVLARLGARERADVRVPSHTSTVSGAVYPAGDECLDLMMRAYEAMALTNPLHPDVFPSARQMEAEVVAMTASFLGGGRAGPCRTVCGAMTSGGTESILSAVKASRDFMFSRRPATRDAPEMVLADSAHPAYLKAASYFKIRVVTVRVDPKTFRLRASDVARAITRRTVLVVASAPGFPHGLVDDLEGIAAVTHRRGVCLHVDACLGGFFLPFARRAGRAPNLRPFDFSLRGVTSMSVDTHKFGMAHKGTSVVLYRSPEIRRHQFTAITDWSGGLYISPGMAGSRSGALIATAWAAMLYHGSRGYEAIASQLLDARDVLVAGIRAVPGAEVIGEPEMSVVAFRSVDRAVDIYRVHEILTRKGWHLNALQRPPALHMCLTARSAGSAAALAHDVSEAFATVRAQPGAGSGGMAPVYGMAGTLPDRGAVADVLVAYQEVVLEV